MLGTVVALVFESFTEEGLFSKLHTHDIAEYCSLVGLGVISAIGVAGQARSQLGADLRRAVLTALTTFDHTSRPDNVCFLDRLIDEIVNDEVLRHILDEDTSR